MQMMNVLKYFPVPQCHCINIYSYSHLFHFIHNWTIGTRLITIAYMLLTVFAMLDT